MQVAVIVRQRSPRDLFDLPYPHIVLWHRFDVPLNRDADDDGRSMMRRPTVSVLARRTALDHNELQDQLYQRMAMAAAPSRFSSPSHAGLKRGREGQGQTPGSANGAARTRVRLDPTTSDSRASVRRLAARPDRFGNWMDSGDLECDTVDGVRK